MIQVPRFENAVNKIIVSTEVMCDLFECEISNEHDPIRKIICRKLMIQAAQVQKEAIQLEALLDLYTRNVPCQIGRKPR